VELLRRLGRRGGTTTLMVTHDNRILVMEDRRLARDERQPARHPVPAWQPRPQ
jgi:ABC-type lipoprotein export system ATPase subunit